MNRTMKKTGRIFCESAHKVWSYPIAGAKGPTHRASGTADPPRGSMSRQPHLVGPAMGAEGYRMATMEVRAIDQDAASSRQIIDRWWSGAAASYCLSWVWKVSAHSPPVHAGATNDLILKGDALGIVLIDPRLCNFLGREDLPCKSENARVRLNCNSTPVDDTDMCTANGPPAMGNSNPSHLTSEVQ